VKTACAILAAALFLAGVPGAFAQGFLNLNFEAANVTGYAPGSSSVPTADAFPGWQAFYGDVQATEVWYDNISGGGNLISIWDTNTPGTFPIQGKFAAALFASPSTPSSISQSALVPLGAKSMLFDMYLENGGVSVTLGGQPLSLMPIGDGNTPGYPYTIYDADISAFADQVEELTFTSLAGGEPNGFILDNIQFSSTPVPEPGTLALAALGLSLLGFLRRQNSSS